MKCGFVIFYLLVSIRLPSQAADVYQSYPVDAVQQGKDEYEKIKDAAQTESMVDYIFGTDCYSRAVRSLDKGCKLMTPDEHATLAFLLTNCFLDNSGRKTMRCSGNNIRECTSSMDEDSFATYQHFFINIFNICLFLENDNFQKQTEHLVRELYKTTDDVFGKMSDMKDKMTVQERQLKSMSQQFGEMNKMQRLVEEGVSKGIKEVISLQQSTDKLEKQMHSSLEVESKMYDNQLKMLDSQAEQQQRQEALTNKAEEHYQVTENFHSKMDDWQCKYQEMQDHLLTSSETLMSRSDDLKDTLVKLLEYEAKTEKAIRQVLGRSFKVFDLVVYALGMVAGLILGSVRKTHASGGPVFAVFCAGLIVHRFLCSTWNEARALDSDASWFSYLMKIFGSDFSIGWLLQGICAVVSAILVLNLSFRDRPDNVNFDSHQFYVLTKHLKKSAKEIRALSERQEKVAEYIRHRMDASGSAINVNSPFRYGSNGPHDAAFQRYFRSLVPSSSLSPEGSVQLSESKKDT